MAVETVEPRHNGSDALDLLVHVLIEHHVQQATGGGRDLAALLTEYHSAHPEVARRLVLKRLGYVPSDPAAWLRVQVERHRFDGPLTCPGFDAA